MKTLLLAITLFVFIGCSTDCEENTKSIDFTKTWVVSSIQETNNGFKYELRYKNHMGYRHSYEQYIIKLPTKIWELNDTLTFKK